MSDFVSQIYDEADKDFAKFTSEFEERASEEYRGKQWMTL